VTEVSTVKATAPGKIILFGEHAVVYGRPAIAVPLSQVRATAIIQPNHADGVRLIAPDLNIDTSLAETGPEHPIALALMQVQNVTALRDLPAMIITVTSDIPIASGLGSGAAITAAIIRALASALGLQELASAEWVSQLTYEVEKVYHGTPSGIDNTVVAYEQPVYFVRRQPQNEIETFAISAPLHLLVADTGISSSTKKVVSDVRLAWEADRRKFERIFTGCGQIAEAGRAAIEAGDRRAVGRLMSENHDLLVEMTVSSPELNRLVRAATHAGAMGAKLSGGGRGGNMIALVTSETEKAVYDALMEAGARSILRNQIGHSP
jgi:mevalonate kinase